MADKKKMGTNDSAAPEGSEAPEGATAPRGEAGSGKGGGVQEESSSIAPSSHENRREDENGGKDVAAKHWRILKILAAGLVVAFVIVCLLAAMTLGPSVWEKLAQPEEAREPAQATQAPPQEPQIIVTCEGEYPEPRTTEPQPYFLEDQIIVTGPNEEVMNLVADQVSETITLSQHRTCRVSLSSDPGREVLQTRLYTIETRGMVAETLKAFEEARGREPVYADANYWTGLLGLSSCGSKHSIGPSPYSYGPSPFESVEWYQPDPLEQGKDTVEILKHSIGPSPLGTASKATTKQFRDQWAFKHIGLSPWPTATMPLTELPTGAGVLAGVFDTSPFPVPEPGTPGSAWDKGTTTVSLTAEDGVSPAWVLELMSPSTPATLPSFTVPVADVRDHGLFVSGLIHGMAPDADIMLVQVLDDTGCGQLFALNEALLNFVAEFETRRDSLDGAVINLSLGLQKPSTDTEIVLKEDEEQTGEGGGECTLQDENGGTGKKVPEEDTEGPPKSADVYIDETLTVFVEDKVESLQEAIRVAHDYGAVVVAAAGNDSGVDSIPRAPHLPAAYPSVIGVAGSNISRQRSCFSNWGDVSAPAGDGGVNTDLLANLNGEYCDQATETTCMSVVNKCKGECDVGLTSFAQHIFEGKIGYAHWSGTSFAAPLVSGLAALIQDKATTGTPGTETWVPPSDVFTAVRCGAPTGDGVIDVLASLYRCMPVP